MLTILINGKIKFDRNKLLNNLTHIIFFNSII